MGIKFFVNYVEIGIIFYSIVFIINWFFEVIFFDVIFDVFFEVIFDVIEVCFYRNVKLMGIEFFV